MQEEQKAALETYKLQKAAEKEAMARMEEQVVN
jgi:hypothetical protein